MIDCALHGLPQLVDYYTIIRGTCSLTPRRTGRCENKFEKYDHNTSRCGLGMRGFSVVRNKYSWMRLSSLTQHLDPYDLLPFSLSLHLESWPPRQGLGDGSDSYFVRQYEAVVNPINPTNCADATGTRVQSNPLRAMLCNNTPPQKKYKQCSYLANHN